MVLSRPRSRAGNYKVRPFLRALAHLFLLRLPRVRVEAELLELLCDEELRLRRGLNEFDSHVLTRQLADPREVRDYLGRLGKLARLRGGGLPRNRPRIYLLDQALKRGLHPDDVVVYEQNLSGGV